jgi:hypothetical protein
VKCVVRQFGSVVCGTLEFRSTCVKWVLRQFGSVSCGPLEFKVCKVDVASVWLFRVDCWSCACVKCVRLQFGSVLDKYLSKKGKVSLTLSEGAVSWFGGLVVSMLASGADVRGFKQGRSHRIFRLFNSSTCLPSEVK